MIPPTIVALTSLVAPPSSKAGQGGGLAKLLFAGDAPFTQSQPVLQFAELLGAARSQIAQLTQAAPTPSEMTGDAVVQETALADLGAEINELIGRLLAEPETQSTQEVVAQFLDILQGAEVVGGSNVIKVLAANLAGLDDEGLAQLDAVARNPAVLVSVLAEMAQIPRRESAVPAGKSFPVAFPDSLQRHVATVTPVSRSEVFSAEKAISSDTKSPGMVAPNTGQIDARALIMGVLVNTSAAAEREVPLLPNIPAEMRAISTSIGTALRPADPGVPQASGFARNLAQQIRSASISEGNTRIALAPRGLGEIEIDLRPDEAGKLRIILRAENPAVLQALRGDRDGLLLALSESGTAVDDAELEFEDFSRKQQRKNELWDDLPTLTPDPDAEQEPQNPSPRASQIGAGIVDILT